MISRFYEIDFKDDLQEMVEREIDFDSDSDDENISKNRMPMINLAKVDSCR